MSDQPWYIAYIGAVPGIGAMMVALYSARNERRKTTIEKEDRERHAEDRDQARLDKRTEEIIDNLRSDNRDLRQEIAGVRKEIDRKQTRILELERDRDKGWNLARSWEKMAHKVWHAWANVAHVASYDLTKLGGYEIQPPDIKLPPLEELPYDPV